ncbi:HAD family hydrolase [Idiomarina aquatica]|uniref:phosphoglycolate phosphatase n=1 Tax=Idiomarina aquatica TaxID=1327752 RepID=A0AA94EH95_9GAMM|nr:HAD-IA family hydrolase [Idiomarina aquatica]RUO45192.1 HAD family hydrolase [Idiomarina aquatica]
MRSVSQYKTLVFDCDGVVLNSNHVKTKAFYKATLPYGEKAASTFVKYHTENGGISRYKKFAHFLEEIAGNIKGPGLDELLERYATEVVDGLLTCDVAEGLEKLRKQTPDSRWLIVSGGDQDELRLVFEKRGLASLFDGGIFGSPTPKKDILDRELETGNIQQPALFIGDSKYDHESAQYAGLDFVFVSSWSEVNNANKWLESNCITSVLSTACLLDLNQE